MQKFLETQKDAGVKSNFVPFLNFENRQAFRQTCRLAKRTIPHTPLVRITYQGNPRQNVLGYDSVTKSVDGAPSELSFKLQDIKNVKYNCHAYAAIKNDGKVVTWGNAEAGGDSSDVQHELRNVKEVICGDWCFAALRNDGTVVTWGDARYGGDSSGVQDELRNVKEVISGPSFAFVALCHDERLIAWGQYGDHKVTNVKKLLTGPCFAVIRNDETVITLGSEQFGGQRELGDVKDVIAGSNGLVVLHNDGSVTFCGTFPYEVDLSILKPMLYNIIKVEQTETDFQATREDGEIITWTDQMII
jgi:hypothetical protein